MHGCSVCQSIRLFVVCRSTQIVLQVAAKSRSFAFFLDYPLTLATFSPKTIITTVQINWNLVILPVFQASLWLCLLVIALKC